MEDVLDTIVGAVTEIPGIGSDSTGCTSTEESDRVAVEAAHVTENGAAYCSITGAAASAVRDSGNMNTVTPVRGADDRAGGIHPGDRQTSIIGSGRSILVVGYATGIGTSVTEIPIPIIC